MYENIQIYSENLIIEGMHYRLTSSCHLLVSHLLKLKRLEGVLLDIPVEFKGKMMDVIKVGSQAFPVQLGKAPHRRNCAEVQSGEANKHKNPV